MIDDAEIEARLRRTFDAVAATTRVGSAPRRSERGAVAQAVRVAAAVAAVVAVGFGLARAGGHHSTTRVHIETPATTPGRHSDNVRGLPSLPGHITVANEDGVPVGYVLRSLVHMPVKEYFEKVNAKTMFPVTDASGTIVGYLAPDVAFVPLEVAQQPGFDIEKVRAERNGGCEDQIGDPNFVQEFPRCDNGSNGR